MKKLLQSLGLLGVMFVSGGTLPLVPEEMSLIYSYRDDCVHPEFLVGTATTSPHDPRPYIPNCTGNKTEYAVSVFEDHDGNKVYIEIDLPAYEAMGTKDGFLKNPKRDEYITLFESIKAQEATAAIAFDAFTASTYSVSSSLTFPHTTGSGSDRALFVGAYINDSADTITGITYNGTSLTHFPTGSPQFQSGGGGRTERIYGYYMSSPDTGTNNVVITATGAASNGIYGRAITYTGVNQSSPLDVSAGNKATSATTVSVTPTTTTDDDWAVVIARNDGGSVTSGTNFTPRETNSISGGDSNASVGAAGSKTVSANSLSTGNFMIVTGMLSPATGGGAPVSTPPASIIWFD